MASDLSPVRVERELPCGPDHAFAVWTGRTGEWWPAQYTADPDTLEDVVIEPAVGGRVFAVHGGGSHEWGRVEVWRPPGELVHSFALSHPVGRSTTVRVTFEARGQGCVVGLEHGGWLEGDDELRARFGDWPVVLDGFAAVATGDGSHSDGGRTT